MLSAAFGFAALAYWNVTGKTINVLTSSAYRAEIEEEYEVPSHVNPGDSIDKSVNAVNTGTVDILVRIKVEKQFGTRLENGMLLVDGNLDPQLIEIRYNQNFWKYRNGFWYYTEVLEAGEKTKEPLFEQYTVSAKAGNAYKGKDADIAVTLESIQAEGDAVALWGIQKKDLGIEYKTKKQDIVTRVTYAGREQGFAFQGTGTDLFANFKNLLPGCARTQRIMIENTSGEKVELFLSAQAAKQEHMSEEQRKMVYLMLSKYVWITVKQEEEILYSGPVDGNIHKTGQSMGEAISLGSFLSDQEKELIVTLSVSPEMEHDMQLLSGRVQWNFSAKGQEKGQITVSQMIPKTGDETAWHIYGISMLVCAGIFLWMIRWKNTSVR